MDLKQYIRDVPDFPEPGILFKDITPILQNAAAFSYVIQQLVERFQDDPLDAIVAVEARGFLFGAPVAHQMGKSLVPVRKQGKLPAGYPYRGVHPGIRLQHHGNTYRRHSGRATGPPD